MFKPIGKILRTDSELWILGFVEMKGRRLLKGYGYEAVPLCGLRRALNRCEGISKSKVALLETMECKKE